MNNKHFIKNIIVENYKCFDYLKVEKLERVNLIGGVNNVGKSAFLEALEITQKTRDKFTLMNTIREILFRRQTGNFDGRNINKEFDIITYDESKLKLATSNIKININIVLDFDKEKLNLFEKDDEIYLGEIIEYEINGEIGQIPLNRIINRRIIYREDQIINNINYVHSSRLNEDELSSFYGSIVDRGMMLEINNMLTIFDKRIDSLINRPSKNLNIFKLILKNKKQPVLLSSMGEGLNRYISIICAIWASQNGQLFIDEIENGIHYTKYEKLWEIIFKTSNEANCQVFATTHSKECIEAFNKVQYKKNLKESKNTAYFEFAMDVRKNSIFVTKRDKAQLKYDLENDMRFRGE